ncbi:LacI family transcriptional regulator [Streptomyces spiroverticillatus]|uniref:LacI family transcriptional regulator n=1 Tax=Streptomyces finlayi TaxID=67296 RepID=A0A918WYS8_9ACTN|nr:LacI family DNA-binding transcriptional regulator [Streptomyces finlayi]GHA15675.1 LacI family transcriptional regulator [Streptomyces spiroverticillatus]GHC96593.1 LacI family transcriptional regulator [Streptomyces finlayi]
MAELTGEKDTGTASGNKPKGGLREVARLAGVSVTTASHALNGVGRVGADTRARVLAVAEEIGYRANPSARGLRRARTGLLGITHRTAIEGGITDIEYFVKIVNAATWTALSHGYSLVLVPPSLDGRPFDDLPLDGTIVIDPLTGDPLLTRLSQMGVPVVTTGRDLERRDEFSWVDNELSTCAIAALDHLESTGARRIALLTGSTGQSYDQDAKAAYLAWTKERGLPQITAEAAPGTDAAQAARELLDCAERPDALYVVLEKFGFAAAGVCRQLGLRIPEDVQVVVGADGEFARQADPRLTALDLHPEEIGREAAELLIRTVEKKVVGVERRLVAARLLERGSTRGA